VVSETEPQPAAQAQPTEQAQPEPDAEPVASAQPEPQAEQPAAAEQQAQPEAQQLVDLNSASFEQLRSANLSVTQATRVLAHRERRGGYSSVDDLDDVPGFPQDVLEDFKRRVTVG
jgi:DNA uptake protein ComE-like DNA-binding protein